MYLFIIPIHIEEPYIYTVYMGRKKMYSKINQRVLLNHKKWFSQWYRCIKTEKNISVKQLSLKSQATPLPRHVRLEDVFTKLATNESYGRCTALALPSGTLSWHANQQNYFCLGLTTGRVTGKQSYVMINSLILVRWALPNHSNTHYQLLHTLRRCPYTFQR